MEAVPRVPGGLRFVPPWRFWLPRCLSGLQTLMCQCGIKHIQMLVLYLIIQCIALGDLENCLKCTGTRQDFRMCVGCLLSAV